MKTRVQINLSNLHESIQKWDYYMSQEKSINGLQWINFWINLSTWEKSQFWEWRYLYVLSEDIKNQITTIITFS